MLPLDPSVSDSGGSAVGQRADVDTSAGCRPAGGGAARTARGVVGFARFRPGGSAADFRRLDGAATLPPVPPRPYFPSVTPLAPTSVARPADCGCAADHGCAAVRRRPMGQPAPPAAPPQARKVARLVSAEAAQSTFKLAADGQLPHLQLQEGDQKDKGQGKSRSIPPLVMIGAWILSVVLTVAIVMITQQQRQFGRHHAGEEEGPGQNRRPAVLWRSRAGRTASLPAIAARGRSRPVPAATSRPNGYTTSRSSICCTRRRRRARRRRPRAIAWRKASPAAASTTGNWNRYILTVLGE